MQLRDERGQTTVLVLGLALVSFAVAGVAVDGTLAFLMRRALQNAADSSAMAGAAELAQVAYYESGGEQVRVDPERARRVVEQWLLARGLGAQAVVVADAQAVRVLLRKEVATTFLRLVGVNRLPVAAEARAEPVLGR